MYVVCRIKSNIQYTTMAGKTQGMSQMKQVLLLKKEGGSNRKVAAIAGINKETVNNYVKKAVTQQGAGGHGQPLWYGGCTGMPRPSQGQVQRGGQRKACLYACLRRTPKRDLLPHRRPERCSRGEDAKAQPEAHAELAFPLTVVSSPCTSPWAVISFCRGLSRGSSMPALFSIQFMTVEWAKLSAMPFNHSSTSPRVVP